MADIIALLSTLGKQQMKFSHDISNPLLAFCMGSLVTLLATNSIRIHPDYPDSVPANSQYADRAENTAQHVYQAPASTQGRPPAAQAASPAAEPVVDPFSVFMPTTEEITIFPPESTPEQVIEIIYQTVAEMPAIPMGDGENDLYVLFDPLCPKCHDMYATLANGLAKKHNLKVYWIPSVVFYDKPLASLLAHKLLSSASRDQAGAVKALNALMVDKDPAPTQLLATEMTRGDSILVGKSATIVRAIGQGTPAVIYKTKTGKIEAFGGIPDESDYAEVGNGR